MGYQLTAERDAKFLHIRVTGENSPETLESYLAEVYKLCAKEGYSSVLIEEDLSGPSLEPVEIYRIIRRTSSQTSPLLRKIAYIDTNSKHSKEILSLGETVARDRGVNVSVFDEVEAAKKWRIE